MSNVEWPAHLRMSPRARKGRATMRQPFDISRPLAGRRVVVTREAGLDDRLSALLADWGAEVVSFPTISIRAPASPRPLDRSLLELAHYDWLIFTSANGVFRFFDRLFRRGDDVRAVGHLKLAAMGPGTAEALAHYHLRADVVPERFVAEALAASLGRVGLQGARVLMPRAREARATLPRALARLGAELNVVEAYRAVAVRHSAAKVRRVLLARPPDVLTFASAGTARNFAAAVGRAGLQVLRGASRVASIGPITTAALRRIGLPPHAEAREYTLPGLAEAAVRACGGPLPP